MGTNWPKPSVNLVGEYQASGHVIILQEQAGDQTVTLKYLAKSITFTNSHASNAQTINFYDSAGSAEAFSLAPNTTTQVNGKIKKFQIVGNNISAYVEVTNIPATDYVKPALAAIATIT